MRIVFSKAAIRQYARLPSSIQRKFDKQAAYLLENLRHPSLDAKKYDASQDVWQARVDRNYRFYFKMQNDIYFVLSVIPHPK